MRAMNDAVFYAGAKVSGPCDFYKDGEVGHNQFYICNNNWYLAKDGMRTFGIAGYDDPARPDYFWATEKEAQAYLNKQKKKSLT